MSFRTSRSSPDFVELSLLGDRFPFHMENSIQTSSFAQKRSAAHRNAESYFSNPEQSASLAKRQAVLVPCAADANTARLRALRLAKEASDRKDNPSPMTKPESARHVLSIKAG